MAIISGLFIIHDIQPQREFPPGESPGCSSLIDPLEFSQVNLSAIPVMDDQRVLISLGLCAAGEIIGPCHQDHLVNDHDFMVQLFRMRIQIHRQALILKTRILSPQSCALLVGIQDATDLDALAGLIDDRLSNFIGSE